MKGLLIAVAFLAAAQASVIKFEQAVDALKGMKGVVKNLEDALIHSTDEEGQVKDSAWPPKFCKTLDCPKFTVVTSTKDYEERMYEASNWVTTSMVGIDYKDAQSKMFMKLFNYISGNNAKGEKIAMTAPVIERIIPGEGPACEDNFTMSFFISPKVAAAPAPKDSTVYLSTLPKLTAYVRSFGGFADETSYVQNAKELGEALPATSKYHKEFFYTGGYDAPFQIFNRHNEVWFIGE